MQTPGRHLGAPGRRTTFDRQFSASCRIKITKLESRLANVCQATGADAIRIRADDGGINTDEYLALTSGLSALEIRASIN
jgi:hypothetical protein